MLFMGVLLPMNGLGFSVAKEIYKKDFVLSVCLVWVNEAGQK